MEGALQNLDAREKWYGIDERLELGIMALKGMEMESVSGTVKIQRE